MWNYLFWLSVSYISLYLLHSYLEIYNEKVRDLLRTSNADSGKSVHNLKVREHPRDGPYVQGNTLHSHSGIEKVERILLVKERCGLSYRFWYAKLHSRTGDDVWFFKRMYLAVFFFFSCASELKFCSNLYYL